MTDTEQAFLDKIEAVNSRIDEVLTLVRTLAQEKRTGYTVTQAAAILHVDRKTIHRWINTGKLRKAKGRIPACELKTHLS
jgi:excisionase family DNA binding protein